MAGDATSKSCTSNSMRICTLSLMRSEFARHSVMLSSSTVFMFSIHSASIGPSNTVHMRSSVSVATLRRMMVDARPSVHSCVSSLNSPYSSPMEMHFGFSTSVCTTWKAWFSAPALRSAVMARDSVE